MTECGFVTYGYPDDRHVKYNTLEMIFLNNTISECKFC